MNDRRCPYCQKTFRPAPYHPRQLVCSEPGCQRQRRNDYHRQKVASDPVYQQVCLESPRKWRRSNPEYWKKYRSDHPEQVERNRRQQRLRDLKRRLANLLRNTRCGLMHSGLLSLGHHCEPEGLSLCSEPRFGASTKVALISPENRFIVSLTRG